MSTKKRFILAAALAFPGMILLFTQNSYFAEKNNIRGLYLVVGILLIVAALYQLVKANQQSNTGNQGNAR